MADTKHEISMKVAAIAALLSKDSELSYETRYGYLQLLLGYVVQERDTAVAQNAAMREVVQQVAEFDDKDVCPNCERTPQRAHDPECRVTKARAIPEE